MGVFAGWSSLLGCLDFRKIFEVEVPRCLACLVALANGSYARRKRTCQRVNLHFLLCSRYQHAGKVWIGESVCCPCAVSSCLLFFFPHWTLPLNCRDMWRTGGYRE